MEIPSLEDIAREAGLLTLPIGGAWVGIKGLPNQRGRRIIPAYRKIGIRHMDIYWGSKEVLVSRPLVRRWRRPRMKLPQAVLYDITRGSTPEEAMQRAKEELLEIIDGAPWHHPRWQTSFITVSHPSPEEIRFFNSEVHVFSTDLIRQMLAENYVETTVFGQTTIPVLEGALQEIVDALQVDGLSHAEAHHHALTHGIIEPEGGAIPQWFYRPVGVFRDTFVEEDDD